jgi:ATP-dependent DNA helicase DinG
VERSARELRLHCAGPLRDTRGVIKLRWEERASRPGFADVLSQVDAACSAALAALDTVSELSPDFTRLAERARELVRLATRFAAPAGEGKVRWIELGTQQARLSESPLDIRDALSEQRDRAPKAWVFTSATLGDDERLSWFTDAAGLEDATALRVGSPFDYAAHARVWVPARMPRPNEPGHPSAVADIAARCARALGGRTFVLTTTLRALQTVGTQLQESLADDGVAVLVQGQHPKRVLMQRFVSEGRAVLVGSQSFWEGIDVPGDALQCVIIDKLPFPPPNDPLVEARVKKLEREGRNAFNEYFVAEAAVSLKQGAGRLIRSESDRGLLVVCDPRLAQMGYGRRLLAALPPMARVGSEEEALSWLRALAAEH